MEAVVIILIIAIVVSTIISVLSIKNEFSVDYSEKIEDIKDEVEGVLEEAKRRVGRVKEELEDVKEAGKDVIEQSKDIVEAVKGDKRKGRKKKATKSYLNSLKKSDICKKVKEECDVELDSKMKKSTLVNKAYTLINKK